MAETNVEIGSDGALRLVVPTFTGDVACKIFYAGGK
jgi:hypothetical protein